MVVYLPRILEGAEREEEKEVLKEALKIALKKLKLVTIAEAAVNIKYK